MDYKLIKSKFCVLVNIPDESVKVSSSSTDESILKMIITEYNERLDKEIKYPSNWREAIKERFFPLWLLRYFPVKYKVFNVHAFYPEYQHPDLGRVEFGFVEKN